MFENIKAPSQSVLLGMLLAFVLVVVAALIGAVVYTFQDNFGLPTLALGGVLVLLAALLVFTTLMNVVGLSDKTQALGLPEGSVRAIIALALVGLFAILASAFLSPVETREQNGMDAASVTVFRADHPEFTNITQFTEKRDKDAPADAPTTYTIKYSITKSIDEFSKQMMTLIGTLMTAVISFYFGATPKSSSEISRAAPELSAVENSPVAIPEVGLTLTLTGSNLNSIKTVRLTKGSIEIESSSVLSNFSRLTCTFPDHPDLKKADTWDVTVTDDMGRSATKKGGLVLK
jgi:hypothetical protein